MWQRSAVPASIATATAVMLAVSAAGQTFRAPTGRVDNVRFERVGGGVITIYYDLKSDDPDATFAILLEVSLDGGQTFALKPVNVSGDVGRVASGMGKKIVWEAGKDVETLQIEQFRIRVTPEGGALHETAGSRPAAPTPRAKGRSRSKWLIPAIGGAGGAAAVLAAKGAGSTQTPESSPPSGIYVGSVTTTNAVRFGGSPFCFYTVTLTDIQSTLDLGSSQAVRAANVTNVMNENAIDCQFAPLPRSVMTYTLMGSPIVNGSSVTIQYAPAASNEMQASLTFTGTFSNGNRTLAGTMTWHRTDQQSPLDWTVQASLVHQRQ